MNIIQYMNGATLFCVVVLTVAISLLSFLFDLIFRRWK